MTTVNIHAAKTQLSRLIQQVELGDEIVIARAGVPVAKLVPYRRDDGPRVPGTWAGRVRMHDDFDELPADIAAAFESTIP